jgi:hypothetical protein
VGRAGRSGRRPGRPIVAIPIAPVVAKPAITFVAKRSSGGGSRDECCRAEVAVMGPEGAVNIVYRRDIESLPTPTRAARKADQRLEGALR